MAKSKTANLAAIVSTGRNITSLRNSFYYGFWLRLKKMGYTFTKSKITTRKRDNVVYLVTSWYFRLGQDLVIISASQLRHKLIIKENGKGYKWQAVCGSRLEQPFLKYFDQEDKPLFIHRLGRQSKTVVAWQNKWLKHMKDQGRWTKRLNQLGVLMPLMPIQMHKPRPRERKPRGI